MQEELVHGIFQKADTIDPYRFQHINDWTHRFGSHRGKAMRDIPTDDLVYLYSQGFYDNDKYKFNESFRKYIYYRYREDYIADKSNQNKKKQKTFYSLLLDREIPSYK